jgi:N-acetylglucosaminyldiphosphoundecaprenol N-acetyl-beta-D-mannosaminyltransferase
MEEIRAFGVKIHPLRKQEFVDYIEESIDQKKKIVQSGINASSIVELRQSERLLQAYNNSDLINIDGMPVLWALRILGYKIHERVACPDLFEALLELAQTKKYSIFLFGAKEKNITQAVENIKKQYPSIIISGFRNGYFSEADESSIVQMINRSKTELLFLGMPSPQKEIFVEKYKLQLHVNYILGVGGFFDIVSGSIKRAPLWMQNIGLEWFYRFIQEPERLLGRYFKGNLIFVYMVIKEKLKNKH